MAKAIQLASRRDPALDPYNFLTGAPVDSEVYDYLQSEGAGSFLFPPEADVLRSIHLIQPRRFEDLMAGIALGQTSTRTSEHLISFIRRQQGLDPNTPLHAICSPILNDTHGLLVYQEQIMEIAILMAGFTQAEANSLRRTLGKKAAEKVQCHLESFLRGALRCSKIGAAEARQIFSLLETHAEFAASKSHAIACALLICWQAYMAVHFRSEWEESLRASKS